MTSCDFLDLLLLHEQWQPSVLCRAVAELKYPQAPVIQAAAAERWLEGMRSAGLTERKWHENDPASRLVFPGDYDTTISTIALLRSLRHGMALLPVGDKFEVELQKRPEFAQIAPQAAVPVLPSPTERSKQEQRELVLQKLIDARGLAAVIALRRRKAVHKVLAEMDPELFDIENNTFTLFWRQQDRVKFPRKARPRRP